MKRVLLVLALLAQTLIYSQAKAGVVSLNVSQDVKLAFYEDDHGNKPYTANLRFRSEWRGLQQSDKRFLGIELGGFMFLAPEFEIAELKGGTFRRYTANVGYTFNRWFKNHQKSTLYLDDFPLISFDLSKVGASTSIGYGVTDYGGAFRSFNCDFELTYDFGGGQIFLGWQYIDRKELGEIRMSGFGGIKVELY